MEENFYEAPKSFLRSDEPGKRSVRDIAQYAGSRCLLRRWLAISIDMIFLAVLLFFPVLISNSELVLNYIIFWWLSLPILYFSLFEGLKGVTFGKLICGIRVVDCNGNKPGILKAGMRTLLRIIEVNPWLAGGIPAGIIVMCSSSNQRLGDMLAGTYVLRLRDLAMVDK